MSCSLLLALAPARRRSLQYGPSTPCSRLLRPGPAGKGVEVLTVTLWNERNKFVFTDQCWRGTLGLAGHILPQLIGPRTGQRTPPQRMEKGKEGREKEQARGCAWAELARCRVLGESLASLDLSLPTWTARAMDLMGVQASC